MSHGPPSKAIRKIPLYINPSRKSLLWRGGGDGERVSKGGIFFIVYGQITTTLRSSQFNSSLNQRYTASRIPLLVGRPGSVVDGENDVILARGSLINCSVDSMYCCTRCLTATGSVWCGESRCVNIDGVVE